MGIYSGTSGNDSVTFWSAREGYVISTKEGDDWVTGSIFPDTIWGGAGNDLVFGEGGDDYIDGEGGDDRLYGGAGNDTLYGRDNDDLLSGGSGNDFLWGEADDDHLEGGSGNDYLNGGEGDDVLYGYSSYAGHYPGHPAVPPGPYYHNDDDMLVGGAGNDTIHGGAGNDVIMGGTGHDTLTGGHHADTFKYSAYDVVTRSVTLGNPRFPVTITYKTVETDTITDFDGALGDRIDLDLLLTQTNFGANPSSADAVAQGYVYWLEQGQPGDADFGSTVYVDRDGGAHNPNGLFGSADYAVAFLQSVAAGDLNANHFIV
jgi:Ca2+-binding RTX toxin-like protein